MQRKLYLNYKKFFYLKNDMSKWKQKCSVWLEKLYVEAHKESYNLIKNPRMFNGAIVDLAEKPYIQQKILLQ